MDLMEHFNDSFNELMELNANTVESKGYRTHNITNKVGKTDVTMALENLASTAMSKTDAFDKLAAANKQIAEALAHITKENENYSTWYIN